MLGAWEVLQSKLQLVHDTSLRLDREQHVSQVEAHLADQVCILFVALPRSARVMSDFAVLQIVPITTAAERLPALIDLLVHVSAALEAALHRMPTPGVTCSPDQVKRHLDALTLNLDGVLHQLEANGLGEAVGYLAGIWTIWVRH